MWDYYGIDWAGKVVIAWAVWNLASHPRRAAVLFMVANVFSVVLAFIATPTILGNVVGDTLFCLMHIRNYRKYGQMRSGTTAITKSPPGDASELSAPKGSPFGPAEHGLSSITRSSASSSDALPSSFSYPFAPGNVVIFRRGR